ncbi:KilA-N domain-containing protein [Glaesserella parasuis]|uniref:KilA-N domain-containing protein n=1 Tax=Glaesserella parasuis TaxID=738 RepID=UPI0003AC47FA|nr:KilA-N domain-containing protein [Glaesserella parasuis]EQA01711.1 kilA-N domain protein [Glaesserella parasuis MN-H]KDB50173.1 bacteriocin [Glaesserella parasuis HPS11]MCT8561295.1 KilA-N domain-containing protein [Glaesserella parasuis]MCT8580014.1 KilA-N domain-containing protein [Glaesserella parasuis]MCT8594151.1 KilA-N domain-containing protein [Glaesserella parasuis]
MSNLTILKTSIGQLDNLFNLKDLHRVSGNEAKHEPYRFVRLDTTKELIEEIQKEDPTTQPLKTLRGTQGGTYACEELALAYAMWISPKFHLVVLRAFLAMHKGELQNSAQIAPLTITPEQQRAIQEAVQQAHYRTGLHWKEIYSRLKSTFNVAKYDQLPQTMFEHVINFLNRLGNQYRPIDRSKKDITIAGLDAEQIAKYLVRARAFAKEVEVFHRKLYEDLGISRYVKNDIAGKAYDIAHEFNVWLDPFIEQVLPQLNQQRLARF